MARFLGNLGEYEAVKEDFESYLERFEQWMIINEVEEGKKTNVFLSIIGAEAYGLLKHLCIPEKPSSLSYEVLSGRLASHYNPKPLVIAERFKFQKRNQRENESVSDYIVALKQLSSHCEFGLQLDEAMRDRFVCGLRVEAIQRRLLTEQDLTFKKTCELSLSMEMASKSTLEFASKMEEPATLNKIDQEKTSKSAWKYQPATSDWKSKTTSGKFGPQRRENHQPCYRCGLSNHAAHECRYKGETCYKCSKVGHIARMCKTKNWQGHTQYVKGNKNETTGNADDELWESYRLNAVYPTNAVGNWRKEMTVQVILEGTPLEMQLDTGAAVTLVSEIVYKKHLSHLPLEVSKVQLSTFSGENIPLRGQVTAKVKYGTQSGKLPLVIVKGDRPALLGRNWLQNFKLDWARIFSVIPARGGNDADEEYGDSKPKKVCAVPREQKHKRSKDSQDESEDSEEKLPKTKNDSADDFGSDDQDNDFGEEDEDGGSDYKETKGHNNYAAQAS
ncbi:uncharacterized protein LOC144093113 [Stigmatopora argus]